MTMLVHPLSSQAFKADPQAAGEVDADHGAVVLVADQGHALPLHVPHLDEGRVRPLGTGRCLALGFGDSEGRGEGVWQGQCEARVHTCTLAPTARSIDMPRSSSLSLSSLLASLLHAPPLVVPAHGSSSEW